MWLAHADGTGAHVVRGLDVDQLLGWNPAGDVAAVTVGTSNRVPYGDATGVELVSAGGDERSLLAFTPADVSRSGAIDSAVWSPDGRAIAVSLESNSAVTVMAIPLARRAPASTWLSLANSQRLTGLCFGCGSVSEVIAHLAAWSPRWGIEFWIFGDGMVHNNDSTPLAVLARPGGRLHVIAQTLSDGTTDAVAPGPDGKLAVVASSLNSGREFGQGKTVENCQASTGSCTLLPGASASSGPDAGTCKPCAAPPARAGSRGSGVSLDPTWSPNGRLLAYVEAPDARTPGWPQLAWYRDHALYVWIARTGISRRVGPVDGAELPTWSENGRELMFVANDGLWLTRLTGGQPIEIEHPLFPEREWNKVVSSDLGYYGQIPWNAQFSWSST